MNLFRTRCGQMIRVSSSLDAGKDVSVVANTELHSDRAMGKRS